MEPRLSGYPGWLRGRVALVSWTPSLLAPGVYAVVMLDETVDGYPLSFRALALLGLFFVGALAFILLDVASDGKLSAGCTGCGDKAATDA